MVRICQSEPSNRQGLSERFYYDARGGIGKSPAPHRVRICQSEPSSRQGLSERFYYDARGGLTNPRTLHGSDLSIRTEQQAGPKRAVLLRCSRGIGKSPAPYMVRICQSEPSSRQGLSERFYYDARGGLANPPHLTWFGFANPNRATGRA
ncbi:hypothetical protein QUF80_14820 [Desulfococcaceae bacterium HSG8]|nr:hypothetical protein [Desulfococcaceae bacterium HSG8]